MAQLLAVIVFDFAERMSLMLMTLIVIFFLFLARFYLKNFDPSGYEKTCLLSLVSTIVAVFLLPIFAGFFRDCRLVFWNSAFLRSGLWFFSPEIFYQWALSLKTGSYKTIILGIILIGLTGVRTRYDSIFSLNVKSLCDYLIKAIELQVILFYFYPPQAFLIFSKVINHGVGF